jgi:phosphatidate cytidylyltransferase
MKKRIITGAGYVAVVLSAFLLREYVDYRLFDILTFFWMIAGTFEVARAVRPWAVKDNFEISLMFRGASVALYAMFANFFGTSFAGLTVVALTAFFVIFTAVLCLINKKDGKTFIISALPFIYPTLFMLTMLLANGLGKNTGFIALLLIYIVSPLSDTFAYFVGSLIGGKKLCPKLSPKKTWSGAIGGTLGGVFGALAVYFIFKGKVNFTAFSPVILFVIVGVVGSVLNIIGDLFESFVKRRVGIKDMGKILPGHGGAMDRMDGAMFLSVFIYLIFLILF